MVFCRIVNFFLHAWHLKSWISSCIARHGVASAMPYQRVDRLFGYPIILAAFDRTKISCCDYLLLRPALPFPQLPGYRRLTLRFLSLFLVFLAELTVLLALLSQHHWFSRLFIFLNPHLQVLQQDLAYLSVDFYQYDDRCDQGQYIFVQGRDSAPGCCIFGPTILLPLRSLSHTPRLNVVSKVKK